jgi:hypothetical protein
MACDCANKIDAQLVGHKTNTRLERAIRFGGDAQNNPNLMLRTEQIETGRGKPKAAAMFLQFCPFCGTRYDAPAIASAEAQEAAP